MIVVILFVTLFSETTYIFEEIADNTIKECGSVHVTISVVLLAFVRIYHIYQ